MNNKSIYIKYKNSKAVLTERLVKDPQITFEKYNNIEQWVLRATDCNLNLQIVVPLKGVTFPL